MYGKERYLVEKEKPNPLNSNRNCLDRTQEKMQIARVQCFLKLWVGDFAVSALHYFIPRPLSNKARRGSHLVGVTSDLVH